MQWHRFERGSRQVWYWSDVLPGDVVQTWGTFAYHQRDFVGRSDKTRGLLLAGSPILVLSRHDGVPGEDNFYNGDVRTFVVLSRHGLLVIITAVEERNNNATIATTFV